MTTEEVLKILKAERAYVGAAEAPGIDVGDFDVCRFADGTFGAGKSTSDAIQCALRNRAAPDGLAAAEEALACLMDHTRGQADAIRLLTEFLEES